MGVLPLRRINHRFKSHDTVLRKDALIPLILRNTVPGWFLDGSSLLESVKANIAPYKLVIPHIRHSVDNHMPSDRWQTSHHVNAAPQSDTGNERVHTNGEQTSPHRLLLPRIAERSHEGEALERPCRGCRIGSTARLNAHTFPIYGAHQRLKLSIGYPTLPTTARRSGPSTSDAELR
jgi:hypothetical protein